MARILISFLGTGAFNGDRSYKTAKYRFADSDKDYDRPFVAAAISEKYQADKMFLLGTVHSMWDGVYDYFGKLKGTYDSNVWAEIYDHCEHANSESALELPHQSEIEAALGGGSRVVLLKYGLNADEIQYNSEAILGLAQEIGDKDEIIVDITHSFRSLPMYAMNLLIYLRNVRGVRISHICYGMLEMNSELKYSPVVELKELLTANDWITGAYSMLEFGNAYKIAELVETIDKNVGKRLERFSDIENLNHLTFLEKQCQELQSIRENPNLPRIAQMVITPVINDFLASVQLKRGDNPQYAHSTFQYRLACWHQKKRNYLAAYISLTEAILSRACETQRLAPEDRTNREGDTSIKSFWWNTSGLKAYAKLYKDVSSVRHSLAHSIEVSVAEQNERQNPTNRLRKPKNPQEMIASLDYFINQYETLL